MYTYNHKCFLYYNGSIEKGSIINRTDGKSIYFSSVRFFDVEYKKSAIISIIKSD